MKEWVKELMLVGLFIFIFWAFLIGCLITDMLSQYPYYHPAQ